MIIVNLRDDSVFSKVKHLKSPFEQDTIRKMSTRGESWMMPLANVPFFSSRHASHVVISL